MPSLIRFLFIVGTLAGLVYLGMVALVTFVVPHQHQITETIPAARLNK
ncbi:MAG: histidine kinase [Methylovirgula sp.]